MKITLENLGTLDYAEIEMSKLTIICGENNMGKTYATYALYGFLKNWRAFLALVVSRGRHPNALRNEGVLKLNLQTLFVDKLREHLDSLSTEYTKRLPQVFASREELFEGSRFHLVETLVANILERNYERSLRTEKGGRLIATLSKAKDSPVLNVVLAAEGKDALPEYAVEQFIAEAIGEIVFSPMFPDVFIASAERTGAAIFRNELDFARTRLLEVLGSEDVKAIRDPFRLWEKMKVGYALPVQDNVEFVRQLETLEKNASPLLKLVPDLLDDFCTIIGGTYKVSRDGILYYIPKGSRTRLTMTESSSSVRSLLDIGFYLQHQAKPGDLLMIDEPELNLHPANQQRLARLLARLVNVGVKVFITTHSDYLVKEFNTLLMFNIRSAHTEAVRQRHRYKENEILSPGDVRLYSAGTKLVERNGTGRRTRINTLLPANIDAEQGIEVETFDDTINLMNEIQNEMLFGGDA